MKNVSSCISFRPPLRLASHVCFETSAGLHSQRLLHFLRAGQNNHTDFTINFKFDIQVLTKRHAKPYCFSGSQSNVLIVIFLGIFIMNFFVKIEIMVCTFPVNVFRIVSIPVIKNASQMVTVCPSLRAFGETIKTVTDIVSVWCYIYKYRAYNFFLPFCTTLSSGLASLPSESSSSDSSVSLRESPSICRNKRQCHWTLKIKQEWGIRPNRISKWITASQNYVYDSSNLSS